MTAAATTLVAPVFLRRRQAAEAYGVSVWTIDELIASGEIRAKRMGRRVLVNAASLEAWSDRLADA